MLTLASTPRDFRLSLSFWLGWKRGHIQLSSVSSLKLAVRTLSSSFQVFFLVPLYIGTRKNT